MEGFLSQTAIDPRTVLAYGETEYRVHGEPGFILLVDRPCAELLAAHRRHGVGCSAFLTACNPRSQRLDDDTNAARQAALAHELRGLVVLEGVGQHDQWPGEASFLVFGLDLEAAKALAERFEQNALVWSGADGVPRLILLR
ncbi:MAG: DUF3293 domain-containing protein [Proteobacteria bacterium]|nr:DUF3293 domain-containing protein [Pseudomonadota bacterium]